MTPECVHINTDFARELSEWFMVVELEDNVKYHRGYSCDGKLLIMWKDPQQR